MYNNTMHTFEIRTATETELPLIEHIFNKKKPGLHRVRFKRQQRNEVLYIFAWMDTKPIGHVLIKWNGNEDAKSPHIEECPDLEDLFVLEIYRKQGLGTKLLLYAEDLIKEKGYQKVGLGVGIENIYAHKLYAHLGFKDGGFKSYTIGDTYTNLLGEKVSWEETCTYLIKDLS